MVARDVTEHRLAEQQRDELAALMVHDFKNPISVVLANVEHLLDAGTATPEEVREIAAEIREAAEIMERMALDLLDVSRSEAGVLAADRAPIDVVELAREVIASVRHRLDAESKQITLQAEPPALVVHADGDLIRRVIDNLLDNSIKYSGAGTLIAVQICHVTDGWMELRVRDQGPGVPEVYRTRIFEKYSRLARDAAHLRTSRGLGLTFCRLAVQAHGGEIWVEGNAPTGSVFCVRLPMTPPARASRAPAAAP
jgi:signal transduction histidine kinase